MQQKYSQMDIHRYSFYANSTDNLLELFEHFVTRKEIIWFNQVLNKSATALENSRVDFDNSDHQLGPSKVKWYLVL